MSKIIYNSLQSSDLDAIALWAPGQATSIVASSVKAPGEPPAELQKLISSVALQINNARGSFTPSFTAIDLHEMISDVIVETSAQGSSLLEIHVIDPFWSLLRRNKSGWCFIDVDPDGSGYLWPPIEINFPPDVSDATWRLAQVKPTTDLSAANLVLTFEDKIVAEMREHTATGPDPTDSSLASSNPNETRAEFIRRCVKTVSKNPQLPSEVGIRFIPLLPHSDFTSADLIGDEITSPGSVVVPNTSPARQNPTKAAAVSKGRTTSSTHVAPADKAFSSIHSQIDPSYNNQVSLAFGTVNGEGPGAFVVPSLPSGLASTS